MSGDHKAAVRRFIEGVWNRGDFDVLDALVAEDCMWHEPGADVVGKREITEVIRKWRQALPDIQCTIDDQIAFEDRVTTRWSLRATHEGELMGAPPTGKQVSTNGIAIHRFEGGRIAEVWDSWDTLGFTQQLGAWPEIEVLT